MGKQRVVDKAIDPVKALQAGITTAQAQALYNGVIPIGDFRGRAAILDIDKLIIQPLIWAEKQWTKDIVDNRNGFVSITVPVGTLPNHSISDTIEVPAGEVWYLCAHELRVHGDAALTAGDLLVNFLVSSFPKTTMGTDKPYYDDIRTLVALQTVLVTPLDVTDHKIITWADDVPTAYSKEVLRDFREWDELNTELRLVGGDKLTLVATVQTATVAGADIVVDLSVWGRVGKSLVS